MLFLCVDEKKLTYLFFLVLGNRPGHWLNLAFMPQQQS